MAVTEALAPVELGPADVPAALALSSEARWNQTGADWSLMMAHGRVIGFRGAGGNPVATALALPMGEAIGWISMVLVAAAWRRRGLASRLVEDCVAWLEARGITPVLDATPDGEQVYARMGFGRLLALTRWQRANGQARRASLPVRRAGEADLAQICACDRSVFGAERTFVLADLLRREGAIALTIAGGRDFLLARRGRLATQIGPVSAEDGTRAIALLDEALGEIRGPVFIDAYDVQGEFGAHLEALGFTVQRSFARMMRGGAVPFGDERRRFAAAGPELG